MTDFFKISPPKARNIFLISLFVPLVRWVFPPQRKASLNVVEPLGGTTFKKPLITFKKVTTHLNFNIVIIAF
jgi:hypothetical protein